MEESSVPKMKTRKAVASRFRVTATGKLKMSQPGKRHLLTDKPAKRKRQLRNPALLDQGHLKTYKRLMCIE
jgi:large subunit ribosomal protein L35